MALLFSASSMQEAHDYQSSAVQAHPLAEVRHVGDRWEVHDMSDQVASIVDVVASVVTDRVIARLKEA